MEELGSEPQCWQGLGRKLSGQSAWAAQRSPCNDVVVHVFIKVFEKLIIFTMNFVLFRSDTSENDLGFLSVIVVLHSVVNFRDILSALG